MKKMDVNKKLILLGLPLLAACMTQPADASSSNRRIYHQINAPHSQARSIQIGSFHSLRNAKLFKTKWRAKINYPIHIKHQGQNYLVIVGPIPPTTERLSNALPDHENVSSVMPPMTRYRNDGLQSFDRREDEYLIPVRPHTSVGQSYHAKNAYHSGWFVGAEAGIMHPRGQSTMLVNSGSDMDPPNNVDRYTVNTSHHNYMGAALGRFWRRDEPALPGIAFGLRYQYIFSHAIDGDVIQYSLSDYNNYRYSWDLSGDVLTAFTKVELIRLGPVMPYVNGGVGVSFNQAGTYNETAAVGIFPARQSSICR
jgi:hypothetical protein